MAVNSIVESARGIVQMERSSVEYSETGKISAWRMNEGRLSLRSLGDRTKLICNFAHRY